MMHHFKHPPQSDYWSSLRFASSGWVSEMLTAKLSQSAASTAMTMCLEKENKGEEWIPEYKVNRAHEIARNSRKWEQAL